MKDRGPKNTPKDLMKYIPEGLECSPEGTGYNHGVNPDSEEDPEIVVRCDIPGDTPNFLFKKIALCDISVSLNIFFVIIKIIFLIYSSVNNQFYIKGRSGR